MKARGPIIAVVVVAAAVGWYWWDTEQTNREIHEHFTTELREACDAVSQVGGGSYSIAANVLVFGDFALAVRGFEVEPDPSVDRMWEAARRLDELYVEVQERAATADEAAEADALTDTVNDDRGTAVGLYCDPATLMP
ncbi:hypothetical protein ACH436_04225 [Isoptericola sp. NPDC019693]|uniref:hypothetical protein n=1 Tax=Isoptericola sp. NPDC019693 TaxID=3364009 RepID=UPI00379D1180